MFYRDLDALAFEPNLLIPGEKPVGRVIIDTDNYYGRHVIFAMLVMESGGLPVDIYSESALSENGSPIWTTNNGIKVLEYSTDFHYVNNKSAVVFGTDDFTILAKVKNTGGGSVPSICGKGDTGSGEWMFNFNSTRLRFYGDSGNITANFASPNVSNTTVICARRFDDNVAVYQDFVFKANDLSAGSNLDDTAHNLSIAIADYDGTIDTGRRWDGQIEWLIILKGVGLNGAQQRRFVDDIYQIVKPANSGIWLPDVAAVGGVTGKSNPLYGPLGGPLVGVLG